MKYYPHGIRINIPDINNLPMAFMRDLIEDRIPDISKISKYSGLLYDTSKEIIEGIQKQSGFLK